MTRYVERTGLVLVAPFWLLGWIVAGVICGPVLCAMEAWDDVRREWKA